MRSSQLAGWIPIRLYWRQSDAVVDWCYLGGHRLDEPFFEQTIQKCLRHPFNQLFRQQTPLRALGEMQESGAQLTPNGLIFHMTRCGSTLISQMLAALPSSIVISEAPPVDTIIRTGSRYARSAEERTEWLRWMVCALGQRACQEEQHLFVKFDAWHVLDFPLIRRAFPGVPAIFLYRDPIEVMVSQLMRTPSWMLTGALEPYLLGLDGATVFQMSRAEYCARVLGAICEAALRHQGEGLRFVNYRQLPEAALSPLLDFFQVEHTTAGLQHMRNAARFDAKSPTTLFTSDVVEKNREATDEIRDTADRLLRPLYDRLEAARLREKTGTEAEIPETSATRAENFARQVF